METHKPFDAVHDTQQAFRSVLEAMTFPGRCVDLSGPARRLAELIPPTATASALLLAAATLLDSETPYWIDGTPSDTRFLIEWCAIPAVDIVDASYLLLSHFDDLELAGLLGRARIGTLADPHLGATMLVGVDSLADGTEVVLSGPGIESETSVRVPSGTHWLKARNERVSEFPLGIDILFFDRAGSALGLPRTTQVKLAQGTT